MRAAVVIAVLLFFGVGYPLWQLQHVRVDCELRLRPGLNELIVDLPDELHSLLLAARGDQNKIPLQSITISGNVMNEKEKQVKTINYCGPDFVEYSEIFANLGLIEAKGKCRIALKYTKKDNTDVPVYLLVTKVK